MDHYSLKDALDGWEERGLKLIQMIDGRKHWKDLCVVNSGFGPSYPCSWIVYDKTQNIIWKAGSEPGIVIGPNRDR